MKNITEKDEDSNVLGHEVFEETLDIGHHIDSDHSTLHNETKHLQIASVLLLVALIVLGLNQLAYSRELKSDLVIDYQALVAQSKATPSIVASKKGSKYYYKWCSAAERISEKNLIYFMTISEALSKGYTPASNCRGLK